MTARSACSSRPCTCLLPAVHPHAAHRPGNVRFERLPSVTLLPTARLPTDCTRQTHKPIQQLHAQQHRRAPAHCSRCARPGPPHHHSAPSRSPTLMPKRLQLRPLLREYALPRRRHVESTAELASISHDPVPFSRSAWTPTTHRSVSPPAAPLVALQCAALLPLACLQQPAHTKCTQLQPRKRVPTLWLPCRAAPCCQLLPCCQRTGRSTPSAEAVPHSSHFAEP